VEERNTDPTDSKIYIKKTLPYTAYTDVENQMVTCLPTYTGGYTDTYTYGYTYTYNYANFSRPIIISGLLPAETH
jgi:hypothetical protein